MLFDIVRQIYCLIKWGVTGVNPCAEARIRGLEMAAKSVGALFRKLFMSSASSAIRTGTVLGLHGAMTPDKATFQESDLSEATVDKLSTHSCGGGGPGGTTRGPGVSNV